MCGGVRLPSVRPPKKTKSVKEAEMKRLVLSDEQVKEIMSLYAAGEPLANIEEKFEIRRHTIRRIVMRNGGEIRKHGGKRATKKTNRNYISDTCQAVRLQHNLYPNCTPACYRAEEFTPAEMRQLNNFCATIGRGGLFCNE